ncbi:cap-specific mRNA (nucleoside-2'-O-)-methyltransferase 1 [Culex quinquefasciatus]|uniref:cap-specific mRNA (nucleoside-2'-O-)-methyltransferase 1 n=1 Tax=Culex quinquefasciatus TaxID=7176 RepID=UPI0018E3421D|nr:cap-specific mRNA (nucleoside-2'-O-)-methyltransferase 1 [Culex quinquefasciatus]XP_038104569.1 cap-specific mRNA (nucleoside-2'-O-)-methyltransferase 1 [Culex quinquefasciatus]
MPSYNSHTMLGAKNFESSSDDSSDDDEPEMVVASTASSENDDEEDDETGVPKQFAKKKHGSSAAKDEEPAMKRPRFDEATTSSGSGTSAATAAPYYSDMTRRMMEKMNYDASKGLGKRGQGRVDIVPVSQQKGRRGLGLKLDQLDQAASGFDETAEVLTIPEKVTWFEAGTEESELANLSRDVLEGWLRYGSPKMNIDDEDQFCEPAVLEKVLESKTAFDKLGAQDMRMARTRSNPFETIKSSIFMNRAAVKMANMDSMFDYMFTSPVDGAGNSLVKDSDLLYFADVCAGPGGFSEYFLWRKKWLAKGFGFTLKECNDFKLEDFKAGTPETFDTYYGPKENGDVFDPENIQAFADYVLRQTETGVHVMMADGGFSVEGRENEQEILSKQLYLCQILVALSIVRTEGHFVVKLFDLFTPFSVGLIYLVSKCFKKISICKPNTSRPANSERYLVCKWKNPGTDAIQRHLFEVNEFLFNKKDQKDILELVPFDVLKEDEAFFRYVYDSNNEIGRNQVVGLRKIAAYTENTNLVESRQAKIRSDCLTIWKLPDVLRRHPPPAKPDEYARQILGDWQQQFLSSEGYPLQPKEDLFSSIHGWQFVPVAVTEHVDKTIRTCFLGRGGKDVFYFDKNFWNRLQDAHLELPPKTLVYGEVVKELQGEGRSQVAIHAFHIIDGLMLGGVDIRRLPLAERLRMCEKFAKAINKPPKPDSSGTRTMPVRSKRCFELYGMEDFFERMDTYQLKDGARRKGYKVRNTNEPDRFYVPRGLLFLSEVRNDYLKQFSKTHNKFYYYHKARKASFFPDQMKCVEETIASFRNCLENRVLWTWADVRQVLSEQESARVVKDPQLVYRTDLEQFLVKKSV